MIALMQQLRREDIYHKARTEIKQLARTLDHREFREHYNNSAEPKTWDQYWNDMLGVTWADHHFIVASAYYLEFNIEIITTSATEEHPSFTIPCNLPEKDTLWLGNITDLHYQSILKDDREEPMNNPVQESDVKKIQVRREIGTCQNEKLPNS